MVNNINILVQAKIDPKAAILRHLKNSDFIYFNIQNIADYLEISRPTVVKYCNELVSENKLAMEKKGRSNLYYVPEA